MKTEPTKNKLKQTNKTNQQKTGPKVKTKQWEIEMFKGIRVET